MPRAWKFDDNINTDLITPGRFNLTANNEELAKHCFIEHRPEFSKQVKQGDIIIAGENFGCGSSRESAPLALRQAGIKAIFAKSFARIFYRNAINLGVPVISDNDIVSNTEDGDEISFNLSDAEFLNKTKNKRFSFSRFPLFLEEILIAGGITNYLNEKGDFVGI